MQVGLNRTSPKKTGGFRAQILLILKYMGPKTLLFGPLDPWGSFLRFRVSGLGFRVYGAREAF